MTTQNKADWKSTSSDIIKEASKLRAVDKVATGAPVSEMQHVVNVMLDSVVSLGRRVEGLEKALHPVMPKELEPDEAAVQLGMGDVLYPMVSSPLAEVLMKSVVQVDALSAKLEEMSRVLKRVL